MKTGLMDIVELYKCVGFIIQATLMDNEFKPLSKLLLDKFVLNITKNEHIVNIHCKIHHLKHRGCRTKASLLYNALQKCAIKVMVANVYADECTFVPLRYVKWIF